MNTLKTYCKAAMILITLLLQLKSFSQNVNFNSGGPSIKDYNVEIKYTEKNSLVLIPVSIEDKDYLFLLDTGGITSVSEELHNRHKFNKINTVEVGDSGSNRTDMDVVSLARLHLGSVPFKDITAVVTKESAFMKCLGIDGVIGSNLLRESVLQISSLKKVITLTDKVKSLKPDRKFSTAIVLDKGQSCPYLEVMHKNGDITAREELLFDTGMSGLYDLSLPLYHKHFRQMRIFKELYNAEGAYSLGMHGAATKASQFKVVVPELTFCRFTMNNLAANTTPVGISRIGASILKYGEVTIDYVGKKLYFIPYDAGLVADLYQKNWPIEPVLDSGKLRVGIVWDPAKSHNIKVGDQIIAFHDANYDTTDICALKPAEIPDSIDTVRVVLRDADTGEVKETEITRY